MNWKDLHLSDDMTHFKYGNINPFGKTFMQAMKFHEPGLAPVQDLTGWFHLRTDGSPNYSKRYLKAFGYYFLRAAVTDETGAFHIDERGIPLYEERYKWCGNFQEEICVVRTSADKYLHIDCQGAVLSRSEYLYAGDFKDGFACIQTENGWTHIRKNQELLHGRYFQGLGVYHKGYATARDDRGWFHIDMEGNALYNERYELVEPFYNGVALVLSQDRFLTIGTL